MPASNISHKVTRTYNDTSNTTIQQIETVTGDTERNYSFSLAEGTNVELDLPFTQANLQSLCLSATTACTIYTNAASGGSPQDTIPLAAGQVLMWTLATDLIGKCPFSGNVTKFYVTNAATTVLTVRSVQNQTV
jgi:hypothetical protein